MSDMGRDRKRIGSPSAPCGKRFYRSVFAIAVGLVTMSALRQPQARLCLVPKSGEAKRAMIRACQVWFNQRLDLIASGVSPASLRYLDLEYGAALRNEIRLESKRRN